MELKMNTREELREEIKRRLLEHRPNICNVLREDESGEYKNYTDEECLDWWALGIEEVIKAESK